MKSTEQTYGKPMVLEGNNLGPRMTVQKSESNLGSHSHLPSA